MRPRTYLVAGLACLSDEALEQLARHCRRVLRVSHLVLELVRMGFRADEGDKCSVLLDAVGLRSSSS